MRELTPILTAIVLAGRTGASFAARIATMQGNEEVDALTVLRVSAAEFLVLPRVVALSLLMPLLYVWLRLRAARRHGGIHAGPGRVRDRLRGADAARHRRRDFAIGAKAFAFGGLVALIGCHHGLRAPRSAAGVDPATTSAVEPRSSASSPWTRCSPCAPTR